MAFEQAFVVTLNFKYSGMSANVGAAVFFSAKPYQQGSGSYAVRSYVNVAGKVFFLAKTTNTPTSAWSTSRVSLSSGTFTQAVGIYARALPYQPSDTGQEMVLWGVDVNFYASPRVVHLGDFVTFRNITSGVYLFAMWDFGYESNYAMTAYRVNPVHRFTRVGAFTIIMEIIGVNGEVNRVTRTNYIMVLPYQLSFSGTPRDGRAPLRVAFSAELVE